MTFLREILVQTHVLPMSFKIFSDIILVLDACTAYVQELFYFHVSTMSHELNRENLDQSHVSLMSFCTNLPGTIVILLGKLTRFWHISYSPTMKAQASLHKCAFSP